VDANSHMYQANALATCAFETFVLALDVGASFARIKWRRRWPERRVMSTILRGSLYPAGDPALRSA
jgi:hypothetical protein